MKEVQSSKRKAQNYNLKCKRLNKGTVKKFVLAFMKGDNGHCLKSMLIGIGWWKSLCILFSNGINRWGDWKTLFYLHCCFTLGGKGEEEPSCSAMIGKILRFNAGGFSYAQKEVW